MTEDSTTNPMLRPFPTAPDIRRYFPASVMEEARERLTRAINRWEGPAHVVGAAGTGKSLLLEVLAAQFREQMSVVALIGAQLCTRRALLQTMLFELGLPHRRMDEGELRLSLVEYLRGHDGNRQQMLLLVDEADALPIRLLQELRVLTNVADQGQPQVSLILAGSAILEERFAEPEMETFSQRISARCYLSPLGRKETFAYVRSQIAASGGDVDQLFNLEGLEAIFAATDGVPRLINQLGDQLIWMSQKTGYQPLDGAIVQQAWSDLQQLPAPWNHSTFSSVIQADDQETESGVIEFGDLHEVPPPHSLNSETPPVESSCDSCPNGDDMPASIPFDPQQGQLTAHPNLELEMETLDVTEKLLQDLSDIQSEPFMESVDGTPPEAYNPFEESFTTEEVVFDQYASFQAQLLSTTSRVVNHQDRQFASELECCELNSNTVAVTPPLEQTLATELRAQSTMHRPDGDHSALLVQGRQFRQLFSQLESGNRPSIYG